MLYHSLVVFGAHHGIFSNCQQIETFYNIPFDVNR